jgi:hypothetical protein
LYSFDRLLMAFPPLRSPGVTLMAILASAGCLMAATFSQAPARAASPTTGSKGADVYCFMRTNGNGHDVSWAAAYAVIKRQSSGVFKTSPEHAAVLITETVVEDPGTYTDCGRFLGDLYNRDRPPGPAPAGLDSNPSYGGATGAAPSNSGLTRSERYGY